MDIFDYIHDDEQSTPDIFPTFNEAAKAAQKLGIKSPAEYAKRYNMHERLPQDPVRFYAKVWADKGGWTFFLGQTKRFYLTWEDASRAAIKLGITSKPTYQKKYKQDPLLPAAPDHRYRKVWRQNGGWTGFLGRRIIRPFPTLRQASLAARALGIKSKKDYYRRYKQHPRLPSNPWQTYKKEWRVNGGWSGFLGTRNWKRTDAYPDVWQAAAAAQKLNIKSGPEYQRRYKEDSRLVAHPFQFYAQDWDEIGGWFGFLAKVKEEKNFYPTVEEASAAVKRLRIKNSRQYYAVIKAQKDPRLPGQPHEVYKKDWERIGRWRGFLGQRPFNPYKSVNNASRAARQLGIKTEVEYYRRYKEHPRLPANPDDYYKKTWKRIGKWKGFLGQPQPYKTLTEASAAAQALFILSYDEYQYRYKEDPHLRRYPDQVYPKDEWEALGRWRGFLGRPIKTRLYETYKEAQQAVQFLGIRSCGQYEKRRHEDPALPRHPDEKYKDVWNLRSGWWGFLRQETAADFYSTLAEASAAAQRLGIKSSTEYYRRYKENSRLPCHPHRTYKEEWVAYGRWLGFLGKIPKAGHQAA